MSLEQNAAIRGKRHRTESLQQQGRSITEGRERKEQIIQANPKDRGNAL